MERRTTISRAAAERRLQVSALPAGAPGGFSAVQVMPFLDLAVDAFGGNRLIFGAIGPSRDHTVAGSNS